MLIPDFIFEPEDIEYLKEEDIFMGEYPHKKSGTTYFKLNEYRFDRLIDIIYDNPMFKDKDKTDIEFDLRILSHLFTDLVSGAVSKELLILGIIGYNQINPNNAKVLMTLI